MFKNVDDYEIQAALHYKDHPMAVFLTNQVAISPIFYEQIFETKVFSHLLCAYNLGL
jgi:hypothetical protein